MDVSLQPNSLADVLTFPIALQYSDIGGLERSIDSAYRLASNRLFEVFIEKFKLLDHLSALRSYLLLGYGDFADQLMLALGWVISVTQVFALATDYTVFDSPIFSVGQVYQNLQTRSFGTT